MITASWSAVGRGFYRADAQKVAEEILSIGEEATPRQIVYKASDDRTELHKCFTWNDKAAAEKWRLHEARHIVSCLVIRRDEANADKPEIRYFHKNDGGGYKPVERVFRQADEYEKLLQCAYSELAAFKRKYANLQELDWLLVQLP